MQFSPIRRRCTIVIAAIVTALLVFAGCGRIPSEPDPSTSSSATASSPAATATTASPTPSATPTTSSPTPTSSPSATASDTATPSGKIVLKSSLDPKQFGPTPSLAPNQPKIGKTTREQEYYAWLIYEAHDPTDVYAASIGADLYKTGSAVCTDLKAGTSASEAAIMLEQDDNVPNRLAQPIVQAAQQSICPEKYLGYATTFDESVLRMVNAVEELVEINGTFPPSYSYGWYTKAVCWQIQQSNGPEELRSYLTTGVGSKLILSQIAGDNEQAHRVFAQEAVKQGCQGEWNNFTENW